MIFFRQIITLIYSLWARWRLFSFNIEKYLEKSEELSSLYRFAKQKGISFKIHPDSYSFSQRFSRKKTATWLAHCKQKKVEIPINPGTRCLNSSLPVTRLTLAHEIGHIVSQEPTGAADYCSLAKENIKDKGARDCLLLEFLAWERGCSILQELNEFGLIGINEDAYWQYAFSILTKQCPNCIKIINGSAAYKCPFQLSQLAQNLAAKQRL